MRVLVTGGSGFIGTELVTALVARGDEVVVADLRPPRASGVTFVEGDLREEPVVAAAVTEGIEAVVHLAAITSVLESVRQPDAVFRTNVLATELLLEGCRTVGVRRFVFASTNAVVGDVGRQRIDESIPLRPLTPYGATKAAGEMLLSAYDASYGIGTVALRFTNVYGRGMDMKDSVIARMMRAALSGGGIDIYGDGEQLRDYLYVSDAVASIELALTGTTPGVLTIGSGESVSMIELHAAACIATGKAIGKAHVAAKPGEMPAVIVDIARARAAGYEPRYGTVDGLAATWEYFLSLQ